MNCAECGAPILGQFTGETDMIEIPWKDDIRCWKLLTNEYGEPVERYYHSQHARTGYYYNLDGTVTGGEFRSDQQSEFRKLEQDFYWRQVTAGIQPDWRPR